MYSNREVDRKPFSGYPEDVSGDNWTIKEEQPGFEGGGDGGLLFGCRGRFPGCVHTSDSPPCECIVCAASCT